MNMGNLGPFGGGFILYEFILYELGLGLTLVFKLLLPKYIVKLSTYIDQCGTKTPAGKCTQLCL